jgi:hypothetical protein
MNTHKTFGFAAAVLVTIAQIAVFATDTAAVAQSTSARPGYGNAFEARAIPAASLAYDGSGRPAIG